MRTLVSIIAFLATHAGAQVPPPGRDRAAGWEDGGTADRAGQLVPVPHESLQPEISRSIWSLPAFWAAVVLILAVLAVGYVRRRVRSRRANDPLSVARQKQQ